MWKKIVHPLSIIKMVLWIIPHQLTICHHYCEQSERKLFMVKTGGCTEGWQLQVQPVTQCYHNDDGPGNGLLPDGTKPLPEPMLTCYPLRWYYEKSFCKIHPFICQLISCKSKGFNVCHSFPSQFSKHHLSLMKLILYLMILLQRYPNSVEK